MPHRAELENQLRLRGLEVLGPCVKLSENTGLLRGSPILQDFTPEEAELLGTSMVRVRARPGQLLIAEGESSDWMMMLLSGTVDVRKRKVGTGADETEPGDAARLAVIKEGAVIGEMSMLDGEPRYASCRALSDVEAAVLSRAAVSHLIAHYPTIGAKLLVKLTQLLAQRLRNTSSKLVKALQKLRPDSVSGPGQETV
ncbi:MAG TPA: cyclic nucleotide-binding domain-containing protein [Ramlibacter sp.]|nr:cyclic nucleotide-binding domain-containing protein [Ramlibacter sp.]